VKRRMAFAVGATALAVLTACSSKLETGYEPNKLDMSLAQRKALYADPYSPAAQDAQNGDDNSSGGQFHNPTSY
jgi:predicted component of type VI protein secretion system